MLDNDDSQVINFELIDVILNFKINNIYEQYFELLYEKILVKFPEMDIRKVHAFLYFGQSFRDGLTRSCDSYLDFLEDFKNYSLDKIINDFSRFEYKQCKIHWDLAKENYHTHEALVSKAKEKEIMSLKSYIKKPPNTFLPRKNSVLSNSTIASFQKCCESLNNGETTDINQAKDIIETIINETTGLVVVDFLGAGCFDNLDYIENDDEILKLYWKYSNGNNLEPHPPHNHRLDIVFEKLEIINFGGNTGVALKGFYRCKNEVKNYYHNKERIKKLYDFEESKESYYCYQMNFDKRQRGGIENFNVVFIPWRYYTIIILPKEKLPSSAYSTKLLIAKNLLDISNRISESFRCYSSNNIKDEDYIMMYGNRFRKILESLLKFLLLASHAMFKGDYEDMLGSILEQLKIKKQENNRYYNLEALENIIKIIEDSLLESLNLCSHDNVKYKINEKIINDIYENSEKILHYSFDFFNIKFKLD